MPLAAAASWPHTHASSAAATAATAVAAGASWRYEHRHTPVHAETNGNTLTDTATQADADTKRPRAKRKRTTASMKAALANGTAEFWECSIHGQLPLHFFFRTFLLAARRMCKACKAEQTTDSRRRHPWRYVWDKFVKNTRVQFGAEAAGWMSWTQHGMPLVKRLNAQQQLYPRECKLVWENGPTQDMQQVVLKRVPIRTYKVERF